jgi:hypothetical protein
VIKSAKYCVELIDPVRRTGREIGASTSMLLCADEVIE